MEYMTFPALIFVVIQFVAFSQGLTAIATLALAGAWVCLGMQLGWWACGRAKRKKINKSAAYDDTDPTA